MKVGTLKRILKNTITRRVFWIRRKWKDKRREPRLSRCSQTNLLLHFSEDQQSPPMGKCSYCHVESGEAVLPKTLCVVLIYSERIITRNLPSRLKPANNLFWYANSVQFFSKNPIPKKDSSNNRITWSLRLPLPTASFFTIPNP